MVNSGQFEKTIHKSNWADLTPSTFSHSQYQLPIAKVIEVKLPYTSSITEAALSLYVMDNKWQVASCSRYSIQPAVAESNTGTHMCIYFTCGNMQQSHKNCMFKVTSLLDRFRHINRGINGKPVTQTHTFSHTGCAQVKKGKRAIRLDW